MGDITIKRNNPKKANNFAKPKVDFMRHLCVWRNFTIRSGKKKQSMPRDPEYGIPSMRRGQKAWSQDQSAMALAWADRPYELDYPDVEFRKANICKR